MGGMQFSGDIVVYLVGLAATWGAAMWRIGALEKKMDKHNCLMERMGVAENSIKVAHHRLDDLEDVLPRATGK
jgi:hypothetical protein